FKGCPANHAVLSPTRFGPSQSSWVSTVLSVPIRVILVLRLNRTAMPAREVCGLFPRSTDHVRLGACVACLFDAVSRRLAGSRSNCGLGDSRLDRHPCAERAGARRGAAA